MGHALRVFGFTDIHWRDRDETALAIAQAAHRRFKPHVTVIMGDLLNCGPFTGHEIRSLAELEPYDWEKEELKPACRWLDWVQKHTLDRTIFIEGNHEFWVERWAVRHGYSAESIYNTISPRQNLRRGRKRFRYIEWAKQSGERIGYARLHADLFAIHGWSACKHAAAKHLELSRTRSVIFGHTHRMQAEFGRDPWSGKPIVAFSAGCLCKLQPIYAVGGSPTQWSHGFWVAYVGKHSFSAYPIPILKDFAILPDGREIRT